MVPRSLTITTWDETLVQKVGFQPIMDVQVVKFFLHIQRNHTLPNVLAFTYSFSNDERMTRE